jgi:phosphoribosylglycinamide formyltransferase-1
VGVLVSGRGTNLRALIQAAADPCYPAEVVGVATNHADCPALQIAAGAGIATQAFRGLDFGSDSEGRDRAIAQWLAGQGAEMVVLAGYDRILTVPLLTAFPGRILNLHNSLLPAFSGTMHAVEAALEHGVKLTGCTVHLLDASSVDGGPIVIQEAVEVEDDDTPETLLERIHRAEWRILPEAVRQLAAGELVLEGRRVRRRRLPQ